MKTKRKEINGERFCFIVGFIQDEDQNSISPNEIIAFLKPKYCHELIEDKYNDFYGIPLVPTIIEESEDSYTICNVITNFDYVSTVEQDNNLINIIGLVGVHSFKGTDYYRILQFYKSNPEIINDNKLFEFEINIEKQLLI